MLYGICTEPPSIASTAPATMRLVTTLACSSVSCLDYAMFALHHIIDMTDLQHLLYISCLSDMLALDSSDSSGCMQAI